LKEKLMLGTAVFLLLLSLMFSVAYAAVKSVTIGRVYGYPTEVYPKTVICVRNVDGINWSISASTLAEHGADAARIRFIGADPWGGTDTIINLQLGSNLQPPVTAPPGTYQYVVEFLKGNNVVGTADPYVQVTSGVGGIVIPVDKFALLAPYIGLVSTVTVATVATVIYIKRVKCRKEKQ
jgi:hypothetical protein